MTQASRQYIIGMAGHIDHGKTALVKALTGIDTDRLKEEKERGITIDLGFAHLSENVTIIDVPGHERLIKNMVAGVSTIDLVLFVIAADDGIMPQTREHLDIIQLLGIQNGIFVITKIDLAEEEWVRLVETDIRNLLQGSVFTDAPIIRTSTLTGEGIAEVRKALSDKLSGSAERKNDGIFRLPVDRVFSKTGFGSVVTGSVISGAIQTGEMVEILPEKLPARIRGLQSHDANVQRVETGFRAAINLAGVERQNLYRGQVLTSPGYYQGVDCFNARMSVLKSAIIPLKNLMRIRLHLHTSEVIGRVILFNSKTLQAGESGYAQIRLEKKIYTSFGDRFIFRQFSPAVTLGGGTVLETSPLKYQQRYLPEVTALLNGLERKNAAERILAAFSLVDIKALSIREIQLKTGLSNDEVSQQLHFLTQTGQLRRLLLNKADHFLSDGQLQKIHLQVVNELEKYQQRYPGRSGMSTAELLSLLTIKYSEEVVRLVIEQGIVDKKLKSGGEVISTSQFQSSISAEEQELLQRIESAYQQADFNPPLTSELLEGFKLSEKKLKELIALLRERNRLIYVDEKIFFHIDAIEKLIDLMKKYFSVHPEINIAEFKGLTNTSRKFAIPLLIYLDNNGITERKGDSRIPGNKLR